MLDEPVHPVKGNAPVVANDAAPAVRVGQSGQPVADDSDAKPRITADEPTAPAETPAADAERPAAPVRKAIPLPAGPARPEPTPAGSARTDPAT